MVRERAKVRRRQPEVDRQRPVLRHGALAVMLVAALALAGTGAAWGWRKLTASTAFPMRAVHVDSPLRHLTRNELRSAMESHLARGYWHLNVDAVRADIEKLPWVESASVRRVWPGDLEVRIREQTAVATWNGKALVNEDSQVFAPARATWPKGLPALSGGEGHAERVMAMYRQLQTAFGKLDRVVVALQQDERRSWSVRLDNGAFISLGRKDVESRVRRFVGAYQTIPERQSHLLASADLRYPNGFALRWADPDNSGGQQGH